MQSAPLLQLARESVAIRAGSFREIRGTFDPVAIGSLSGATDRTWLSLGEKNRQDGTRNLYRTLALNLQQIADDMQHQLDTTPGERVTIPCTDAGGVIGPGTEIDLIDTVTGQTIIVRCTSSAEAVTSNATQLLIEALIASTTDPNRLEELKLMRATGVQLSRQNISNVVAILNANAASMRESLRRIGLTPQLSQATTITLDLSYRVPFRNGVSLTPRYLIQTTDDNYVGKPRNPEFGGKGLLNTFTTAAGFELFAPLRRGRGRAAADADEMAARLRWLAGRLDLQQAAAQTTFSTANAYLTLIFAQDRVSLYEESSQRLHRIAGDAGALVTADQIAPADLGYVRARIAASDAQVSMARAQLASARAALARAMGLPAPDVTESPVAADRLPTVGEIAARALPEPSDAEIGASEHRTDFAAAGFRSEATRVIREAARLALQPRVDLTLFVGYSTYSEAISYGRGLRKAMFGPWMGPSIGVLLDVEVPYGNRAATGRLEQASALQRLATIDREEIVRTAGTQITATIASLEQAKIDVRHAQAAADAYERTLDSERQRFAAGEGTAFDSVLTADQLTSAHVALHDARLAFAQLELRLAFETGRLVARAGEDEFIPDEDAMNAIRGQTR